VLCLRRIVIERYDMGGKIGVSGSILLLPVVVTIWRHQPYRQMRLDTGPLPTIQPKQSSRAFFRPQIKSRARQ
jgi:hypothetical protein